MTEQDSVFIYPRCRSKRHELKSNADRLGDNSCRWCSYEARARHARKLRESFHLLQELAARQG